MSRYSLSARVRSFYHAFSGIAVLIHTQTNARIHLLATIIVVSMGLYFNLTKIEWCVIVLAITLVWSFEAMNTALEFLCDVTTHEYHPLVKHCKDTAAAAVLIAALGALTLGVMIFYPHFSMSK